MGRHWLSRMGQEEVALLAAAKEPIEAGTLPLLCTSPQGHTPTAPQHCLFSIQLLLTQVPGPCRVLDWAIFKASSNTNPSVTDSVYLLWCWHYTSGAAAVKFFLHFILKYQEKYLNIPSSSASEADLPVVLGCCLCSLRFQYFFMFLLGKLCCCT